MEDRRFSPRIPLDTPCFLTMIVNGEEEFSAMLVDVGQGGMQLALPPASGVPDIKPGASVVLQTVCAPLDSLLEGVCGNVAWVGERCCGVKLLQELAADTATLTNISRL
jgi:hypothetical protein